MGSAKEIGSSRMAAMFAQHVQAAARAVQGVPDTSDARSHAAALRGVRKAVVVASADERKDTGHVVISHKGVPVPVTAFEAYMFDWFGKDSAAIPTGVFATAVILASGLFSLQQKKQANQQYAMRSRV